MGYEKRQRVNAGVLGVGTLVVPAYNPVRYSLQLHETEGLIYDSFVIMNQVAAFLCSQAEEAMQVLLCFSLVCGVDTLHEGAM